MGFGICNEADLGAIPAVWFLMAQTSDARVREILSTSPTIAVLGIHHEPGKAAFYVPEYLHDAGYRILGVNPRFADRTMFGERVRATLAELREPIDLVDVFRRPDQIAMHVEDILAMQPRPKVVWFQLGIRNDEAARILEAAGITVIQDRCTLADHQRLGLGAPARP
jgi:predicted CoA-binding protein